MTPTESELTDALIDLKTREPHLGISKIHALLSQHYPEWVVSEKRTRKILQAQGLTNSQQVAGEKDKDNNNKDNKDKKKNSLLPSNVPKIPYIPKYTSKDYSPPPPSAPHPPLPPLEHPTSKLIPLQDLDVSRLRQWNPKPKKIEIRWFGDKRGKGLVAVEEMEEGEVVWKEEPWIVAPEWEIWEMQMGSLACGYCTTPLNLESPLVIPCSAAASSSTTAMAMATSCPIRFCNRLCLARSSKVHPLLCGVQNPASVPLLKYSRDCHWMALHALAHVTSRVMLVNGHSEEAMRKEWEVVDSWAVLGMRERVKCSYLGYVGTFLYFYFYFSFIKFFFGVVCILYRSAEPDHVVWEKGHQLYCQAFKEPKTQLEKKRLAKLLKKPLPDDVDHALFDYEDGFLKMLGKMNLSAPWFFIYIFFYFPVLWQYFDRTYFLFFSNQTWKPTEEFIRFIHTSTIHAIRTSQFDT